MSVCLAEHYSSLSVEDCLGLGERRGHHGGLSEDPLVDLPLLRGQGESFALPPGVQVRGEMRNYVRRTCQRMFYNVLQICANIF